MNSRAIEPDMRLLEARMESVAATFDHLIASLVGSRRAFTLLIHPKGSEYATLSVANAPENVEAVRAWLRKIDERGFDEELPDPEMVAANLAAIARGAEQATQARSAGWSGSMLLKKERRK